MSLLKRPWLSINLKTIKIKSILDDFEARNPYTPGGGYAQGSVRMQKFNDALRDAKLTNVYQEFIRISYYNHYPEPK